MASLAPHAQEEIRVEAPARLHMGFMDLGGADGRCFGSLGLTLEGLGTRIVARRAPRTCARGEQSQRVLDTYRQLQSALSLSVDIEFVVESAIPAHAGLGSGTQLAIAVGMAAAAVNGSSAGPRAIARLLRRGARSGIGIAAFEQGGFLVDGGRGARDAPPPLVARMEFPADWRVILLFDTVCRGLHGGAEVAAFRALPPFPEEKANRLCRRVLMGALPALAEADLAEFSAVVSELQRTVGDHFAVAQGGRYTSKRVSAALQRLEDWGVGGVGQSSWGPTGFAIVDSEDAADACIERLRREPGPWSDLELHVCSGRNRGGEVQRRPTLQHASA